MCEPKNLFLFFNEWKEPCNAIKNVVLFVLEEDSIYIFFVNYEPLNLRNMSVPLL